jgi:hypothetical protein
MLEKIWLYLVGFILVLGLVMPFDKVEAGHPDGGTYKVISPSRSIAIVAKAVSDLQLKMNNGTSSKTFISKGESNE